MGLGLFSSKKTTPLTESHRRIIAQRKAPRIRLRRSATSHEFAALPPSASSERTTGLDPSIVPSVEDMVWQPVAISRSHELQTAASVAGDDRQPRGAAAWTLCRRARSKLRGNRKWLSRRFTARLVQPRCFPTQQKVLFSRKIILGVGYRSQGDEPDFPCVALGAKPDADGLLWLGRMARVRQGSYGDHRERSAGEPLSLRRNSPGISSSKCGL